MSRMKEVEARLESVVQAQMHNDRITGTCGMEAGTTSVHCEDTWEKWMDEGARIEMVAICAIINSLTERFDRIVKSETTRYREGNFPHRTGALKCDLYSWSEPDADECGLMTKEEADRVVCIWREKGTKVQFDPINDCWEEVGGCEYTIPAQYVEEDKNEQVD